MRLGERFADHRQQDDADGAYSVLMCRPDAATRSITPVAVRPGGATTHYEAVRWSSPSQPTLLAPVVRTLARRPRTTRACFISLFRRLRRAGLDRSLSRLLE